MSDERPSFTVEYLEPGPDRGGAAPRRVLRQQPQALAADPRRDRRRDRRGDRAAPRPRLAARALQRRRSRAGSRSPSVLELASCASYVLVFRGVFCDRMSWRTSTEIGLSELAANSLLSVGGAGGLALGAWILRRGGLPATFIAQRTVAFFLLTSLANVGFLAHRRHRARHRPPARRVRLPARPRARARRDRGDRARARRPRRVAGALAAALDAREARRDGASAIGDGVDEALRLLQDRRPADHPRRLRLHALRRRDARRLLRRLRSRRAARRRAARRLHHRPARQPDPDPRRHRRRRRRADRHARPLRRRRRRRRRRGDRLPRAAADDPGAARAARARGPAQAAPDEAHDIAACAPGESVEVLGRGTVERGVPVTAAADGTSARPRSRSSSPRPARRSG